MSPFEVLYGRKSTTPINKNNPKDKLMLGTNMLKETKGTVKSVKDEFQRCIGKT